MRYLIGAAFALCSATAAQASDWYMFERGKDGAVFYADRESHKREGQFVSTWVKIDLSAVKTASYVEAKQIWKFDCQSKRSITLSSTAYFQDGRSETRDNIDNPRAYSPVVPDSIAETLMTALCTNLR